MLEFVDVDVDKRGRERRPRSLAMPQNKVEQKNNKHPEARPKECKNGTRIHHPNAVHSTRTSNNKNKGLRSFVAQPHLHQRMAHSNYNDKNMMMMMMMHNSNNNMYVTMKTIYRPRFTSLPLR